VSAPAELPAIWPSQITIAFHHSPYPPTFENRYTSQGRSQILHAASQPIELQDIPESWHSAPIIHLGPVLKEIPEAFVMAFPHALIGVTPQGWMRSWEEPLPAAIRYEPWLPQPTILQRINALVLSIEDVQGDEALVAAYAHDCSIVVLTRGAKGATLFLQGVPYTITAHPASEKDPTGAGDVFAASLFCALQQGTEPLSAANFAAKIAAASVETTGADGIVSMHIEA
jgi:sugar/nucleoside kinase (ribokinase family)